METGIYEKYLCWRCRCCGAVFTVGAETGRLFEGDQRAVQQGDLQRAKSIYGGGRWLLCGQGSVGEADALSFRLYDACDYGGETLWGIADTYDTLVSAILTANPSLDAMNLQIGTRIYVPFSFALVDEQVPYTSSLTDLILEGLKVRYPFLISGCIGKSVMGREVCYLQFGEGRHRSVTMPAFMQTSG